MGGLESALWVSCTSQLLHRDGVFVSWDEGGLGRGCVNGGALERGALKGFIGGTMH